VIFFGGMVLSGVRVYNSEQLEHGQQVVSLGGYLLSGVFYEAERVSRRRSDRLGLGLPSATGIA